MRTRAKRDRSELAIVQALEAVGCLVARINGVGQADLLVCKARQVWLLEVKDGSKAPSRRRLTKAQEIFHAKWREAPLYTVTSIDEALAVVNRMT